MNVTLKNIKVALLYGFFIWLIPFALSFLLFPIYQTEKHFFQSIMSVTLVSVVVYFTYKYSQRTDLDTLSEGFVLGLLWMLISLTFDYPVFSLSPLKMPLVTYWKEIGFAYLAIPIITSGCAHIVGKNRTKSVDK